jgi:dTDP-4-amino-4,6-dideoxygalactose transaminase
MAAITSTVRSPVTVPFFRPELTDAEIAGVVECLRSGWLTTGPRVRTFEQQFAAAVGARYAIAVNSCTAALHLALEALDLKAGQAVLVPTMTFAATAEVVRYLGAVPVLVDCEPANTNMDLGDAERKLERARNGTLLPGVGPLNVVGVIPVHVGGLMMEIGELHDFAAHHSLWLVDDAAHAFPAAWRTGAGAPWQRCGERTAAVSCFSFYANKTITTGEGGMAVTDEPQIADRMRTMSLHGLSHDAWERYSGQGSWDYRIVAPGYKYNLTDIAAAIGIAQLLRANQMRLRRHRIAQLYRRALASVDAIELPPENENRIHAWHLFPIRVRAGALRISRDEFVQQLGVRGVASSVHWRPLHLHPYYQQTFRWPPELFPIAGHVWQMLVSLPVFPAMRDEEQAHVVQSVMNICASYSH